MVRHHHWLNGHESEQLQGMAEDQRSLACCSPRCCRVRHDLVTEQQQRLYCMIRVCMLSCLTLCEHMDSSPKLLPKSQVCVPDAWWGPSIPKHYGLEQKKAYHRFIQRDGGSCPKNPKVTKKISASHLKAKGEGWAWWLVADFSELDPLFSMSGHG